MITFIGRGGLKLNSSLQFWQSANKFSSNRIRLAGPLDVLDVLESNVLEVAKDVQGKPSEVYRQKVEAGELTADPHQEKVVAQVKNKFKTNKTKNGKICYIIEKNGVIKCA